MVKILTYNYYMKKSGTIIFYQKFDTTRGGATLEPGCAAAHPDFLKNQRKIFFYIDNLNLKKIVNTFK